MTPQKPMISLLAGNLYSLLKAETTYLYFYLFHLLQNYLYHSIYS